MADRENLAVRLNHLAMYGAFSDEWRETPAWWRGRKLWSRRSQSVRMTRSTCAATVDCPLSAPCINSARIAEAR